MYEETTHGAMHSADEERDRVAQPTDRRPDFSAEAMSPGLRIGFLVGSLFAALTVIVVVAAQAFVPGGLFGINPFLAVMAIGVLIGSGFFMLLVFGALLGNNPRIRREERIAWAMAFVLLGPFVLWLYWLIHVWPVPYQPSPYQRL